MKKRLFNIHKLIGINLLLFFFISLFFGILTIFQPYINLWEDQKKHFAHVQMEDIPFEKCIKQVTRRTYISEDGTKVSDDLLKFNLPSVEFKANNLIRVNNRPNFYLDPRTCKRVRPKTFTLSLFFDRIHTGAIFNSLIFKILFGFMSVGVVFLSLSGLYLLFKNKYRNSPTKTVKGFFAKYHRLLSTYTLPLIFMFGLTGALFNLGVYSSPVVTSYLTQGKTSNVLTLQRNILVDPDLPTIEATQKVKALPIKELYAKAKAQFDHVKFYEMQLYNINDVNGRIKFIGYEPRNFFISSQTNESYVVLNTHTAQVLSQKIASEGTFTEKTLDAIFYLHYLRTFSDTPRIIFAFISCIMLFALVCAVLLYLFRANKEHRKYKILTPLFFTIVLGSVLSACALLASNWLIPKSGMHFQYNMLLYHTQEVLFYTVFVLVFMYISIKKNLFHCTVWTLILSGILLLVAAISHGINSGYSIFNSLQAGLLEIFFMDIGLISIALLFFLFAQRLRKKYIPHK